jgi:hypothetical protein
MAGQDPAGPRRVLSKLHPGLIRSGVCVGWHWHRYADNDPDDKRLDPSNRDSNKGIVTNRYEPFPELLESMSAINHRVYSITRRFDSMKP